MGDRGPNVVETKCPATGLPGRPINLGQLAANPTSGPLLEEIQAIAAKHPTTDEPRGRGMRNGRRDGDGNRTLTPAPEPLEEGCPTLPTSRAQAPEASRPS